MRNNQGRSQDLRGGKELFFQIWEFACREATSAHGKVMRFARVVRGHAPREIFLKWCNLVLFGVHFDPILSLKFFENYHFFYNFFFLIHACYGVLLIMKILKTCYD